MIGNDIIDIAQAKQDSNWQRPRFLEKLFSEQEQRYIQYANDSFLMVWRLWSMKEAAYKLYTQLNPSRFYNPKKLECFIEDNSGVVKFEEFTCFTSTMSTSDYILSEAKLESSFFKSKTVILPSKCHKTQSEFLKEALLKSISEKHDVSKKSFQIKKDSFGIPTVVNNHTQFNISLTHHGNYGAFAIV